MERRKIETYEEAVEYLLNIPRFTSKNTMEDTKAFLKRLGNPDQSFRIIHVAGTNGKGSVCAYLRMMLEEAGYTTCVFTSPHLVDVRERFLIKGRMVGKEAFLHAFLRVYDLIPWDNYHPSFFEYLFFMAMLLFQEAKPDYCILETGLGGRLDATNSVSRKALAVITRISLDHMEYLGDTPEKIAAEKAGIIAKGAPVVYLDTTQSVNAVFDETARKMGASECIMSRNDYALLIFRDKNIDFSLRTRYYNDIEISLHTTALYQMENASLAVRALETMDKGRTISAAQIKAGLERCHWPGRMEEVTPDVFVDGAHNEDGVRAFLESVQADGYAGDRILLFSAVKDKAFEKMLQRIVDKKLFSEIYLVPLHTGRTTSVQVLEDLTRRLVMERQKASADQTEDAGLDKASHGQDGNVRVGSFPNVEEAVRDLWKKKKDDQRLYVAGSLYLVGEVLAILADRKN